MPVLPNPFAYSALEPAMAAEPAAAPDLTDPPDAAADYFDEPPLRDEPLPLFLTDPAPEMDRELEAMVRVHFGVSA